jgi:hypothetical protein
MSRIVFSRFQVVSTYYDFATDAGAIGALDLNVIIPKNCIVTRCFARTWIAPTSAGLATVSFDRIVGAVTTTGFYIPANAIANYNLTAGTEVLAGSDFNANPRLTDPTSDSSVGCTIAVAALTAGRIQLVVQLQMTDNLS